MNDIYRRIKIVFGIQVIMKAPTVNGLRRLKRIQYSTGT